MMRYGILDAAGNWVATDKDGKPLPTPPVREDRIAAALESIASSLEKIANPLRMVAADGTVLTLEESLSLRGLKIVKDEAPLGPVTLGWTIPRGLRESGPADG